MSSKKGWASMHQWALRFIAYLGCCEQCCSKHGGAHVSEMLEVSAFILGVLGLLDSMVALVAVFEVSPYFFP